jgi:hypothetical protein
MSQFIPAIEMATNDRIASAYVSRRGLRDVQALGEELRETGGQLGYATLVKTATGFEVRHGTQIVMCTGFVCACAYILAKFW